ncbi:MAG: hypothetical protein KDJ86_05030 [Bauldia sp.]|uniref:calcium-binding protein n=1 Tax=Bauldia sp. TaxID=2575872 RepID=UPI001D6E652E|nr:calcium-binding protein [Bauldia sp.]MCB1495128.1 hypothetical protein [Bauldia sp.]
MALFKAVHRAKPNAYEKFDALLDGKTTNSDPEHYNISSGKVKIKVEGTGFEYTGAFGQGYATYGTIEKMSVYVSGTLYYKVKGLTLPIANIINAADLDDALHAIFLGDDTVKGSKGNDTLRGFGGNDTIKGGAGKDKLQGDEGNDTLSGGRGKDQFIFKDGVGNGIDTITKLAPQEKILLDHTAFKHIGSEGPLDPSVFHEGNAATTADHHVIYHPPSGTLLYDPDGVGSDVAVAFARLPVNTELDVGQIFVI